MRVKRQNRAETVLAFLAAALCSGCAIHTTTQRGQTEAEEQAQVKRRLDEIFDATQKKDFIRLDSYHLYGKSFTKFGVGQSGRQDASAGQKGEHDGLAPVSHLAMQADDLKIDVFREAAIATFILNYSFEAGTNKVARSERSTLVFVKDAGEWKIAHEHFSPFKAQP
jgi:ketosteroid isomerase-like protein